jgi:hypothetical protein
MAARWFDSVGDDCALFVEAYAFGFFGGAVAGGRGVLVSNILRTGGGGGVSMSSILRIGGLLIPPLLLVPGKEECLGTGASTSSMLLTGDRGVAKGDPVRATGPVEVAEPFGLPFPADASRMAKTSFRSSSNTDSNDMSLCAMFAEYVYRLRLAESPL